MNVAEVFVWPSVAMMALAVVFSLARQFLEGRRDLGDEIDELEERVELMEKRQLEFEGTRKELDEVSGRLRILSDGISTLSGRVTNLDNRTADYGKTRTALSGR